MLSSLSSAACCGRTAPSRKPSHFSACLFSLARILTVRSGSTGDSNSSQRINYGGVRLEENVKTTESGKLRLDSWISSRISGISRARVQYSIKTGLVSVNGKVVHKVVHPAPGNAAGTLVNGILHHCSLPPMAAVSSQEVLSDAGDVSDEEELCSGLTDTSIRPGIVHRLDKGTSGLLVVAKDEHSHAHLAEQFKLHTIQRLYVSLTIGVPSPLAGRVDIPIGRDVNNRIRMAAIPGSINRGHVRHAASRYKVIEKLAQGGSALVEWRLETGRTHQIRAHAKHMGIPLLGDDIYGGTKSMALSLLQPRILQSYHSQLSLLLSGLERPCLHAVALGFTHPHTAEKMHFTCSPPPDFANILSELREMG